MSGEDKNIGYFARSTGWNLCCKQATYLLLKKEELSKLSFKEESALKFHMAICKFCRAFRKQSELMNELISKSVKISSFTLADADKNNLKSLINKGLNEI
ncbi:MAG: hypothetical protein ACXVPN_04695 [Bacteroidia bacterium]